MDEIKYLKTCQNSNKIFKRPCIEKLEIGNDRLKIIPSSEKKIKITFRFN